MKSINIDNLRKKFGLLLSFLHEQCEIEDKTITTRIINSKFFDFMENDELNQFLNADLNEIAFQQFGVRAKYNKETILSNYLYAGECYISCSISLSIPLRKLFLLYPLEDMLFLFPAYHEMALIRTIERVRDDLTERTTLSIILKQKDISIKLLSELTSIRRDNLSLLSKKQSEEEKLTIDQLRLLCDTLNVDDIFFKKSVFVPYSQVFWNDENFVEIFKSSLSIIIQKGTPILLSSEPIDSFANKQYVLLSYNSAYYYRGKKMLKKIPDSTFDLLLKITIKKMKEYCLDNHIAFC